jgi:hypothetical protein
VIRQSPGIILGSFVFPVPFHKNTVAVLIAPCQETSDSVKWMEQKMVSATHRKAPLGAGN